MSLPTAVASAVSRPPFHQVTVQYNAKDRERHLRISEIAVMQRIKHGTLA